jgi:hypothetical protein
MCILEDGHSASSTSSTHKKWKVRKDSTAIGQVASLAVVALLVDTNRPQETEPPTHCYHSEPERLNSYRSNSIYVADETRALLSKSTKKRKGSGTSERYTYTLCLTRMTIIDC